MKINRRKFVAGAGTAIGGAAFSTTALAESIPVKIAEVYPVEDVVILENTGDEDVDLGGYVMDWKYGSDPEQVDEIPSGTTIGAGEQLSIWSGFQPTQVSDVEADVQLDDYGNGRINAEEVDSVALLIPAGDVVDQTEDTINGDRVYDANDYNDDDSEADPELVDIEFEYKYRADNFREDDIDLESKLEVSSAEYFVKENVDPYFESSPDSGWVTFDVVNLTDDEEITIRLFSIVMSDDGEIESTREVEETIEPGDTISVRQWFSRAIDADRGEVRARATRIGDCKRRIR